MAESCKEISIHIVYGAGAGHGCLQLELSSTTTERERYPIPRQYDGAAIEYMSPSGLYRDIRFQGDRVTPGGVEPGLYTVSPDRVGIKSPLARTTASGT